MKRLIDFLMGGAVKPKPEPTVWQFIGHLEHHLSETDGGRKREIYFRTLFFMTDKGARKVEHTNDEKALLTYLMTRSMQGGAIKAWLAGGAFPDDFVPVNDPLGEMLSKLIDQKLLGEETKH